jgi:hypothetical protein
MHSYILHKIFNVLRDVLAMMIKLNKISVCAVH